jgi:hypothetical protein
MIVNYYAMYNSKTPKYFNPRKSRVKITTAIYPGIFITFAPGVNVIKLFSFVADNEAK